MRSKTKVLNYLGIFYLTLCGLLATSIAWSEPVAVEPEADRILKEMSTYLAGVNKFTVTGHLSIETMLDSGQKIMLDHYISGSIHRPDKFFSTRKDDFIEQSFYYDGKTFTLYNRHPHNYYTNFNAPNTLSAALNEAIKKYNLIAPGVDLLYKDSYTRLTKELISGFYVGKKMIDGVECHHLAFRNPDVDWQIWIQTGDKPLPKRYIITSRWITGSPQFSLNVKWNTSPDFSDDIFNFVVPEKAEKIEILTKPSVN